MLPFIILLESKRTLLALKRGLPPGVAELSRASKYHIRYAMPSLWTMFLMI